MGKKKLILQRKVRVRIVKDEDDQVIVSLYEDIVNEPSSAEAAELKSDTSFESDDAASSDKSVNKNDDKVNQKTKTK